MLSAGRRPTRSVRGTRASACSVAALLGLLACGQSFSTGSAGDGGAGDGGARESGAADAATADARGSGGSGGSSGMGEGSDSGSAGDAPSCPAEGGSYVVTAKGKGCGPLAPVGAACVRETACTISIDSPGSTGLATAMDVALLADGSFANAVIYEGSLANKRSGCSGAWDAKAKALVIDCGGTGSAQSCVVVLTRTSPSCM